MKKNNKSGFTLVELLAVVVILSVLLTMAIPAVLSFTTRMKKDMFCNKVDTIIKSAQLYGQDNMQSIINERVGTGGDICKYKKGATEKTFKSQGYKCVRTNVKVLVTKGYLTKEKEDPKDSVAKGFYDPRDGSSMLDRPVFVYIKNKRAYAEFVFSTKKDAQMCGGSYYGTEDNIIHV